MRDWIIRIAEAAYAALNDRAVKKALLKRAADALEKLAIGSALVGIFQKVDMGIYLGVAFFAASCILSIVEAKI